MRKYIDVECEVKNEFNYDLYAVIYHVGDLNGGHYYTSIKLYGQEDCFQFNDTQVTNIRKDLICTNGYILFYTLRD